MFTNHSAHVEVGGKLAGVSILLPSCASQTSKTGDKAWLQVPFCAEPSYQVQDLSTVLFSQSGVPENQPGFPVVPQPGSGDIRADGVYANVVDHKRGQKWPSTHTPASSVGTLASPVLSCWVALGGHITGTGGY